MRPLAALLILERVFHVMTEGSVLNPLLAALLGGGVGGGPSLSEIRMADVDHLEVLWIPRHSHLLWYCSLLTADC